MPQLSQEQPARSTAGGSTLALIRGESSRQVLANTARTIVRSPVFVASYLRRRDRRAWVFGNLHGFRDSSRYLAEHVLHEFPELSVHWIAHDPDEADQARAAGLNVAMYGDREAVRLQRRAGVAFFAHGFRDLDLALVFGAHLVYLWHGTPLKRVGLDVKPSRRRPAAVRMAASLVRWLQLRAYRLVDTFVASGELEAKRFGTAFGAPRGRIRATGSPRFDVIRGGPEYRRIVGDGLRERLGYRPEDRLVLWLPTHRREYGDAAWLPALTARTIDESLGKTNIKLLVKTHPRAEFDVYRERLPEHERIRLLAEKEVDVNCLLHIADALVSDYSSVVFDYAILGRPIHFFAPDVERYGANRGLYEPYSVITSDLHHEDWPSLLAALRADVNEGEQGSGAVAAARLSEYCRNNVEPDTCRRLATAIIAAAGVS